MPNDCFKGKGCTRYGCTYKHPHGRWGDCRDGAACTRPGCRFQHPRAAAGGGGAKPKPKPKGGGGGAMVLHKAGTKVKVQQTSADGHTTSMEIERYDRPLVFNATVDASSSMEGSRTRAAVEGLGRIFDDMAADDMYGLATFGSSVRRIHHPMVKSRVDWSKDAKHIVANGGGCTALWDGIVAGIQELRDYTDYAKATKRGKKVAYQLVLTDGEDNSSSATLEQAAEMVAKPGLPDFHFVVIGIGVEASTRRTLEGLCKPRHAQYIHVNDVAELTAAMRAQAERIRVVVRSSGGGRPSTSRKLDMAATDRRAKALVAGGLKALGSG